MDSSFREQIERARRMTPNERVREGFRLFEQGRDYIVCAIRETFPEATDEDVAHIRDMVLRRAREWGIT